MASAFCAHALTAAHAPAWPLAPYPAAVATVKQRLLFVGREEGKLLALRQLIAEGLRPPVLVFVATKERAKELHRWAGRQHGGRSGRPHATGGLGCVLHSGHWGRALRGERRQETQDRCYSWLYCLRHQVFSTGLCEQAAHTPAGLLAALPACLPAGS